MNALDDPALEPALPPRAPSRAGHRRPQLVRSISSRNLFPDLPPIRTSTSPPSSDDSDSSDDDDKLKPLSVALPPLCPPSPVSPTSSTSSSSLDSPPSSSEDLHDYQDEPGCDGFPPAPLPQEKYIPTPPSGPAPSYAPNPNLTLDDTQPTLFHHGLSRSAFTSCREFWDRRAHAWNAWRERVDHLDSLQATYARDGLRATLRYPPPPVLPRTRALPGQGANGNVPGASPPRAPLLLTTETSPTPGMWYGRERLQTYNPYAPIFPRMGDLPDLRAPYCDWPDRAFVNFPTYSIAKTLFLHDMLGRAHTHAQGEQCQPVRRWELAWRARWQVLIDRQPCPPQPYPPSPHASPVPAHGWHAPPPPPPEVAGAAEQRYTWDATEDIPSLVPLEAPFTAVELEGAAPQTQTADVFDTGHMRAPTPVQGWTAPTVRLPPSTGAFGRTRCAHEDLASVMMGRTLDMQSPSAEAGLRPGEDGADGEGEGEGEGECSVLPPPRPASPALKFYFYGDAEDAEEDD